MSYVGSVPLSPHAGRPKHAYSVSCRYRRLKHGGAGVRLKPLVDVMIDPKNVNSALVVDGYQCIDRSLNTVIIRGVF